MLERLLASPLKTSYESPGLDFLGEIALQFGEKDLKLVENGVFLFAVDFRVVLPFVDGVPKLGGHVECLQKRVHVAGGADVGESLVLPGLLGLGVHNHYKVSTKRLKPIFDTIRSDYYCKYYESQNLQKNTPRHNCSNDILSYYHNSSILTTALSSFTVRPLSCWKPYTTEKFIFML